MKSEGFRELLVWRQAMALAVAVYQATEGFPRAEEFGLKAQLRKSAVSIPSNIAEGSGRGSNRDFQSFLCFAKGSARELETQIELAQLVGHLPSQEAQDLTDQAASVARLLNRLIASLNPVPQK